MSAAPRRIVTGHDAEGRGVVVSNGPPPVSRAISDGATFHELWATAAVPAPLSAAEPEPTGADEPLAPPAGGTRVRVVDLPPGTRSPMHRTETVDYGIVLEGEVHLILDDSELALHPGDIVVQRGTDHAWENRSAHDARMVFVLVDGAFTDELRATLP
jgi:quercetin dioxygenase-like cupin family protein